MLTEARGQLDDLQEKVKARQTEGLPITRDWVERQDRYKDLILQLNQRMADVGTLAKTRLKDDAQYYVDKAQEYVKAASRAQLERTAPTPRATAEVMAGWSSLPDKAIRNLLGNFEPGSPLIRLLEGNRTDSLGKAKDALLTGITTGAPPQVTAKRLQEALGLSLSRAMTIVRTEGQRVQREASRQTMEENKDIVEGWEWRCARTPETCEVCWAMDGETFDTDETMEAHVNCRCVMVPKTVSWESLGYKDIPDPPPEPTGPELFEGLPEKEKRQILGLGKYELYRTGRVGLRDLQRRVVDRRWGASRVAVPLRDLQGDEDEDD
jgi:SPP1 gp7 family putative phage head morphogenesis protein